MEVGAFHLFEIPSSTLKLLKQAFEYDNLFTQNGGFFSMNIGKIRAKLE